jgi:hypothetical protein
MLCNPVLHFGSHKLVQASQQQPYTFKSTKFMWGLLEAAALFWKRVSNHSGRRFLESAFQKVVFLVNHFPEVSGF